MLSDQEKRELLEMAASASLREDLRELRRASQEAASRMTPDQVIAFLSFASRLGPAPARPGPPVERLMLL